MAGAPDDLRRLGFLDRLQEAGIEIHDEGDVLVDPGFRQDPDPRLKNQAEIAAMLRATAQAVATATATDGDRLLLLGGDCCTHAGALAGLRRADPDRRLAIAWFDAHGDCNTPETTPTGNVWGMPFALLLGRGDPGLVAAAEGPAVDLHHAALIGGQVLDEAESRWLSGSAVAHFGAGMLATAAGLDALRAWADAISAEVDGLYVAIDHDVLDADEAPWALTMPESGGIRAERAVEIVRTVAAAMPVVGYGATTMNFRVSGDADRTVDVAARLAIAALA
jgi:arginase